MKKLSALEFDDLLRGATHIRLRLKRELRFTTSIAHLSDEEWSDSELVPIYDRSGTYGVLVIELDEQTHLVPFSLKTKIKSSVTGRSTPVVCDFCRTWRPGSQSARITFPRDKSSANSVSYLCCADLHCSLHARNQTPASLKSTTQLREDITIDGKVARLRTKLDQILRDLKI